MGLQVDVAKVQARYFSAKEEFGAMSKKNDTIQDNLKVFRPSVPSAPAPPYRLLSSATALHRCEVFQHACHHSFRRDLKRRSKPGSKGSALSHPHSNAFASPFHTATPTHATAVGCTSARKRPLSSSTLIALVFRLSLLVFCVDIHFLASSPQK
jgi:hypothetical protein